MQDYAKAILASELHNLAAWALDGAIQVIRAGRFLVPSTVLQDSHEVVVQATPVFEFLDQLAFGP